MNGIYRMGVIGLLALAGCSKPAVKWDYEEVEGDETTLQLYGHYGWDLVSSAPDKEYPDFTNYTFKRAEGGEEDPGESLAESKDQGRVFQATLEEIDAPEPQWKRDYDRKMAELNAKEEDLPMLINGNEGLIDAAERLADAQIDNRADLDDAGKTRAKAAAAVYFEEMRQGNDGTPMESGTFLDGSKF